MRKTEQDIERDFYRFVKESRLAEEIGGNVYRDDLRPYDSGCEDIVVRFVTGLDGQIQTGYVQINIFVQDIVTADGLYVADKRRIAELQTLILEFLEQDFGEYLVETESTPHTLAIDDRQGEHLVYCRLRYRYFSN